MTSKFLPLNLSAAVCAAAGSAELATITRAATTAATVFLIAFLPLSSARPVAVKLAFRGSACPSQACVHKTESRRPYRSSRKVPGRGQIFAGTVFTRARFLKGQFATNGGNNG